MNKIENFIVNVKKNYINYIWESGLLQIVFVFLYIIVIIKSGYDLIILNSTLDPVALKQSDIVSKTVLNTTEILKTTEVNTIPVDPKAAADSVTETPNSWYWQPFCDIYYWKGWQPIADSMAWPVPESKMQNHDEFQIVPYKGDNPWLTFTYWAGIGCMGICIVGNAIYIAMRSGGSKSDVPEVWQLGTQDPATAIMEGMNDFHNFIMFIITVIGILVFWLLYKIIKNYNVEVKKIADRFNHSSLLEIIWTIIPAVVLIWIAIPSFSLLYSLDDGLTKRTLDIKIIGHQWYWSYEYSNLGLTSMYWYSEGTTFLQVNEELGLKKHDEYGHLCIELAKKGLKGKKFDSYMKGVEDLVFGSFRLLETDNRVVMPINTPIRLLITAADVLHSWTIPSFGIKLDACPGRLSQAALNIRRIGTFYGQCSEICGVNHGFMPIVVESVGDLAFFSWRFPNFTSTITIEAVNNAKTMEDLRLAFIMHGLW